MDIHPPITPRSRFAFDADPVAAPSSGCVTGVSGRGASRWTVEGDSVTRFDDFACGAGRAR